MTSLAPTLQAYFTTRLTSQYGASPHTLAAYRDTWRLLLGYAAQTTATAPVDLDLSQLDADLINGFLTALETQRGNGIATRNARLAAVHSFFTYASHLHPEHLATIGRVLAIPPKRRPRNEISYLTDTEVTALLAAPDQATGPADATTPCSNSPSPPGYASPNSPHSRSATSIWAWVRTCFATAKAARTEPHPWTGRPCKS